MMEREIGCTRRLIWAVMMMDDGTEKEKRGGICIDAFTFTFKIG